MYGVLTFSYSGYDHFGHAVQASGFYTSNLGDNAQTIAARQLFEGLGVAPSDIASIDRDTLATYDGPPVRLLMNGVFKAENLPAPPQVQPIFLGFMALEDAILPHLEWLARHAPIGCRDPQTAGILQAHGVEAFVSGCVTLTLPRRTSEPAADKTLIVYGTGAGVLPAAILGEVPRRILETAEFISHRHVETEYPLSPARRQFNERFERMLLDRYRHEATLVLTPLLHVASPCLALGVPVVLFRSDHDSRFGHIAGLTTVYTLADLGHINWTPGAPDVSAAARFFINRARQALA
jgi:hypothetical protein